MPYLLTSMLAHGDQVAIKKGRLQIVPASGLDLSSDWLKRNWQKLHTEIAEFTGIKLLEYLTYSVGNYGPCKAGGVTLQFASLSTDMDVYTIFNVDLKQARHSKHRRAGSPLPGKQFRVKKNSAFIKFWRSTELTMPNRLGKFHQHMGTLQTLIFTGTVNTDNNRIDAKSLLPANITATQIRAAMLRDYSGTEKGQLRDSKRTNTRDKKSRLSYELRRSQQNFTRGDLCYENKVIRKHGNTGHAPSSLKEPLHSIGENCHSCDGEGCAWCRKIDLARKSPKDQTTEEWLEAYVNHEAL
jgi:hypothetical protein